MTHPIVEAVAKAIDPGAWASKRQRSFGIEWRKDRSLLKAERAVAEALRPDLARSAGVLWAVANAIYSGDDPKLTTDAITRAHSVLYAGLDALLREVEATSASPASPPPPAR